VIIWEIDSYLTILLILTRWQDDMFFLLPIYSYKLWRSNIAQDEYVWKFEAKNPNSKKLKAVFD